MIVYLAGPIDAVTREEALGWRYEASRRLEAREIATFDPAAAFYGVALKDGPAVRAINRVAVLQSTAVLANLLDRRGFGTVREIEFACERGIPVYAAVGPDFKHLDAFDMLCFPDLRTAIDRIVIDRIMTSSRPHGL